MSKDSDSYPSWLPKRPLHPAPASTFHSSVHNGASTPDPASGAGPSTQPEPVGGRKATPRSVRIVSLQDAPREREPTEQTRVVHQRVWSRGMGTPTLFAANAPFEDTRERTTPQPRFRARGLHLELLRATSPWMRLYFYLWPLLVFAHIPLQTFLDFNAVFILVQIAKHPNPLAPGVPGSGRNWALATAAYIFCWALWLGGVVLVYELVYCFVRRWRAKRPPILALYLSASAFSFVALTSYTNFCFFQHLRWAAFSRTAWSESEDEKAGEKEKERGHIERAGHRHYVSYSGDTKVAGAPSVGPATGPPTGSFLDGLAETCYFYAQNLPTVTLLLPRAALCLAVLLAFSAQDVNYVASVNAGVNFATSAANSALSASATSTANSTLGALATEATAGIARDSTFFRAADGTLTDYARGVLIANAAWAVWRAGVCLVAWIGLWLLSGAPCAGLCGPRDRWEEEANEKSASIYRESGADFDFAIDDGGRDVDALPWKWREYTALRVQLAYEFCLTVQRRKKVEPDMSELLGSGPLTPVTGVGEPAFEGMEQVMAAIGFPSVPSPARRGVLSGELFESPEGIQQDAKRSSRDRDNSKTVYPFIGPGAQMSSQDRVPFPPSPGPPETQEGETSGSGSLEAEDEELEEEDEDLEDDDEEEEEDDEEEDDDEEEEEEEDPEVGGSEEPSSGRASGSMSSLGQPVASRYPFQFRRPARGASASSHNTHSTNTRSNNTRSTNTRGESLGGQSRVSQSTGNVESSSSGQSPRSARTSSSVAESIAGARYNSAGASGGIPMPPRHPQQGRGRNRAGTVPVPSGSSASILQQPVDFPTRERMDSGVTSAFGAQPQPGAPHGLEHEVIAGDEAPESEGSHEHAGEREDRLGLLSNAPSAGPSPKSSLSALRQRASNISLGHRRGYSQSRSHSGSGSASGSGPHSRTQSSHSGSSRSRAGSISVNVVRSRTQSLLQGIGAAASQSSTELVQRMRANSSMARLEEDSDARTHSRSGSGTTSEAVLSSGGENNTFGHPLRTTWHDAPQAQQQRDQPPPSPVQEGSDEGREEAEQGTLHPAQSRTSVFSAPSSALSSPSVATATEYQPSRAPSPERRQAESAGIPIPRAPQAQELGMSSPSSYGDAATSTSYPDISTAPQSFVTAPATVEGSTTESSGGRTDGLDSWGVAAGVAHMRDPSRGGGHGAWGHHGPA